MGWDFFVLKQHIRVIRAIRVQRKIQKINPR